MGAQRIIGVEEGCAELEEWLKRKGVRRIFLVSGNAVRRLRINRYFEALEKEGRAIRFSDFAPNPTYESVVEGVRPAARARIWKRRFHS